MTEITDKKIEEEKNAMDALEAQQLERTKEYLAFQVENALEYFGSESNLEDWDNCPEIIIRLII